MADDGFDGQRVTAATFLVEVDGVEIGRFMEISGLEVTVGVEDVEEGGENSYVHKLPGRMTWPNVTLKRGITQNDGLLSWLNKSSGEQFAAAGQQARPVDGRDHARRSERQAPAGVGVRRGLPGEVDGPELRGLVERHGDRGAGDHPSWIPGQEHHLSRPASARRSRPGYARASASIAGRPRRV